MHLWEYKIERTIILRFKISGLRPDLIDGTPEESRWKIVVARPHAIILGSLTSSIFLQYSHAYIHIDKTIILILFLSYNS